MAADSPAGRAAALRDPVQQSAPVTVADLPAVGRQQRPDDTMPQMEAAHPHRRWPWFVAAAGAVVLLGAGGAYAAWRTIQGQYYVAADGGDVVIYQGIDETVLGKKLSHVKERPTQPLHVADLTPQAQTAVKKTIDNLDSLAKARQTVANLRGQVCRTTVSENSQGVVAVWKGKGQQQEGCDNKVIAVSDPPVHTNQLTTKSKESVRKGIPVPDLNAGRLQMQQLHDEAYQCSKHPGADGCPGKPSGNKH